MRSSTLTLGARFVFPVEGAPIADGRVTIEEGRIAWIGPSEERSADLHLGNVAITPGFVNAPTHLELSSLAVEASAPGGPEDELSWLRRVIDQRRQGSLHSRRESIGNNLAECVAAGTTLLADTTTAGLSWDQVAEAPLRGVVFAEVIGLKRERGLQSSEEAWDWLTTIRPESQVAACARPGLSPHAPYSTAGWLYHRAAASRLPLSTHLAEMPEELELLEYRDGPLRRFLEDLGAWDDEWEPVGTRPADYVRRGDLRRSSADRDGRSRHRRRVRFAAAGVAFPAGPCRAAAGRTRFRRRRVHGLSADGRDCARAGDRRRGRRGPGCRC